MVGRNVKDLVLPPHDSKKFIFLARRVGYITETLSLRPRTIRFLCLRQTSREWIRSLSSWPYPLRFDPALLMPHVITSNNPTVNSGT